MSEINYQALREAAQNAKDLGGIKNYKRGEQAVAEFESLITPHIVLALLEERERNQQYIKRRDQENEMMVDAMHAAIALTSVGIDLDDYDECVLRLHEWGALPDYCIALYVDFVHGIVSKNKLLDFGYINGAPVWTLRDELEAAEKRNAKLQSENAYIRNRYKELDLLIGKNILVMQAAIIEWQSTGDAKSGLAWIYNTLFGPGELPDESEKDAQAYFNRKYAPIDEKLMELHKWFWEQSEAERATGIRIKGDAGEQNDEKP
ncbi:ead/Ea22-like family protein [Escherichia coli]